MGNRVQRVRTEVSEPQMAQAVIQAWKSLFGSAPAKEQVAMVIAQNNLETGHRKSMWNNNVGNITTDGKGSFDYFDDLATDEQITPGHWKRMNLKYRAYPSLEDGVLDYLKFLSKNGRYAKAWQNIVNPDPVAFSKALKAAGYYTANEAPYTKSLTSLFNSFNKSNAFELAMSGKVQPAGPTPQTPATPGNVDSILNKFLQMVASTEKDNKKLYKVALPKQDILIQISSSEYNNSVEFARVLCATLDEELLSSSYTHTDGHGIVEVECSIPGPSDICLQTVSAVTQSVVEAFEKATSKIGGITVEANCIVNKKSFYQPISISSADTNYRRFLLKFI